MSRCKDKGARCKSNRNTCICVHQTACKHYKSSHVWVQQDCDALLITLSAHGKVIGYRLQVIENVSDAYIDSAFTIAAMVVHRTNVRADDAYTAFRLVVEIADLARLEQLNPRRRARSTRSFSPAAYYLNAKDLQCTISKALK